MKGMMKGVLEFHKMVENEKGEGKEEKMIEDDHLQTSRK
jgi:hypothetical protein